MSTPAQELAARISEAPIDPGAIAALLDGLDPADRVAATRALGRHQQRRLYAAVDALLLPSYYDPCSLVVLESLACGTPVVTSRHNGASELLEPEESGFVLEEPSDVRAMMRALEKIDDRWEALKQLILDPGIC